MGKLLFGSIIEEYSIKAKTDTNYVVCSVTNTNGFQKSSDTFDKKVFSEDLSAYKKVYRGSFAYNPSRINVGSIGCQNIDECVLVSPLYNIFEVNTDVTTPEFVSYFIRSNYVRNYIKENTQGTVRANFKMSEMSKLHFPNITLDEQKRIIEEFKILEKVIKENEHQLFLYDELVKSRFVEIFGDVLVNDRCWPMHKWNDVLLIRNGKNQKKVENENGKYPICGSGGVMSYADDYICNENSVIIGRKGNINNPILMREKYWNVDTAFGLEPHINRINVDYLYMFCNFYDFLKHKKTVTIPSLTKTDLLKIDIPTPPIRLQNEFSKFVQQINKLKFIVEEQLKLMNELLNKKMDEYFN